MGRNNDRDRGKRTIKDTRPRGKKKVCHFCKEKTDWVDYKDVNLLRRYMSDRGKIRARRVSGNCAQHQRDVQVAIKTARELALLPYTQRTVSERGPGRGGPRGPGRRDDARGDVEAPAPAGVEDLDEAAAGDDVDEAGAVAGVDDDAVGKDGELGVVTGSEA